MPASLYKYITGPEWGKSLWNKLFWYAVIANNHEVMPRTRQIWYSKNVKNTEVTNAHCNFSTHFLSHYFDIKSNSVFILSYKPWFQWTPLLSTCYNTCGKGNNTLKNEVRLILCMPFTEAEYCLVLKYCIIM